MHCHYLYVFETNSFFKKKKRYFLELCVIKNLLVLLRKRRLGHAELGFPILFLVIMSMYLYVWHKSVHELTLRLRYLDEECSPF
jgi:hypothetical protein